MHNTSNPILMKALFCIKNQCFELAPDEDWGKLLFLVAVGYAGAVQWPRDDGRTPTRRATLPGEPPGGVGVFGIHQGASYLQCPPGGFMSSVMFSATVNRPRH